MDVSRRTLLASATALSGLAVGGAALPASLTQGDGRHAARDLRGRLSDIEHIVILMQENRSFDHYFGTMPGVRGFADPTAITLPERQLGLLPAGRRATRDGYLLPFHYDTKSTSAAGHARHRPQLGAPSTRRGTTARWTSGSRPRASTRWATSPQRRHPVPLGARRGVHHLRQLPLLGARPDQPEPALHVDRDDRPERHRRRPDHRQHAPRSTTSILSWTTYPERLEAAGVSWQVYQEEDNYDDNALAWFKQFANAPTSSPLWQRGMLKRPAGGFEADARATTGCRRCPGWSRPPRRPSTRTTSRPPGPSTSRSKLDAIASNEDLWRKTLFILTYDENDGMFDHVPPPVAPAGTADEFVDGLPIGLGFRVPTIVVSPWTVGGYVCSDVLDHTSLIRFIEARFGVTEPNISAWRRADLRRLHHGAAPARRPGPLAVAEPGGQPGRRRGQLPDRPAGGLRQPGARPSRRSMSRSRSSRKPSVSGGRACVARVRAQPRDPFQPIAGPTDRVRGNGDGADPAGNSLRCVLRSPTCTPSSS